MDGTETPMTTALVLHGISLTFFRRIFQSINVNANPLVRELLSSKSLTARETIALSSSANVERLFLVLQNSFRKSDRIVTPEFCFATTSYY